MESARRGRVLAPERGPDIHPSLVFLLDLGNHGIHVAEHQGREAVRAVRSQLCLLPQHAPCKRIQRDLSVVEFRDDTEPLDGVFNFTLGFHLWILSCGEAQRSGYLSLESSEAGEQRRDQSRLVSASLPEIPYWILHFAIAVDALPSFFVATRRCAIKARDKSCGGVVLVLGFPLQQFSWTSISWT